MALRFAAALYSKTKTQQQLVRICSRAKLEKYTSLGYICFFVVKMHHQWKCYNTTQPILALFLHSSTKSTEFGSLTINFHMHPPLNKNKAVSVQDVELWDKTAMLTCIVVLPRVRLK